MSGYGFNGGTSRCHPYWQEFTRCYAYAISRTDCKTARDDYMECLHHKKEKARLAAIQAELQHKTAEDLKDLQKQLDALSAPLIPPASSESKADK